MRTQGITPDPAPVFPVEPPDKPDREPTEGEKLGKELQALASSESWPLIENHIAGRIEHFKGFLPDGRPVELGSDAEVAAHYRAARIVIKELEDFRSAVNLSKPK